MKKAIIPLSIPLVAIMVLCSVPTFSRAETSGEVRANASVEANVNSKNMLRESIQAFKNNEATTSEDAKRARQEMRSRLLDLKSDMAAFNGSIFARVSAHVESISKRLSARVELLENIHDRIDSRIEKMKENGTDTSVSEKLSAEASLKIDAAGDAVENVNAQIDASIKAVSASSTKAEKQKVWTDIKAGIKKAEDSINEARKALADTVSQIKVEAKANVTTKAEVTN